MKHEHTGVCSGVQKIKKKGQMEITPGYQIMVAPPHI